MKTFILRRLLYIIPMLFIMSMVVFVVITLPPGDPLTDYEQDLIVIQGYTPETARKETDRIREWYGLDKPKPAQYSIWIYRFIKGDFGWSFTHCKPVATMIGTRIFYLLLISTTCLGFTWLIGIPIGILSAVLPFDSAW